jgi:hypothetical protein
MRHRQQAREEFSAVAQSSTGAVPEALPASANVLRVALVRLEAPLALPAAVRCIQRGARPREGLLGLVQEWVDALVLVHVRVLAHVPEQLPVE